MAIDRPRGREPADKDIAGQPVPHAGPDAGAGGVALDSAAETGEIRRNGQPPEKPTVGIGPYRLAMRRLRRNKVALIFLGVFILIVILCVLSCITQIAVEGELESILGGDECTRE